MSQHIHLVIEQLIAKGVEFQVGLRGSPSPLGPGKVEPAIYTIFDGNAPVCVRLYKMLLPANMQENKNARPKSVILPITFDAADVQIVIEAPINRDGDTALITPGGRGPSGLHIPGAGS